MPMSTSQLRSVWGPACSGTKADLRAAYTALDAVMQKWSYKPRAGVTGAYNCRRITGGTGYSLHAFGPGGSFTFWTGVRVTMALAVDVCWDRNPYGPKLITDMPRGMIEEIKSIRTNNGKQVWGWGGDYGGNKDAMHFECVCAPADIATGIRGGTGPGPVQPPPKIGKKQMFVIIRYSNGSCYRWNGINRCPIPNPRMLGGDQIMLTALGMDATIHDVDEEWANSFPEVADTKIYWNTRIIGQKLECENLA